MSKNPAASAVVEAAPSAPAPAPAPAPATNAAPAAPVDTVKNAKEQLVILTPKDVQTVGVFRLRVHQIAQQLRPGDPIRGMLYEALFDFQINALPALTP